MIVKLYDFEGRPMGGREAILQFKAPGAEVINAGGPLQGGVITFSKLWLQASGTVRVTAVSTGRASIVPDGVESYTLPSSGAMTITGHQKAAQPVKVTAKDSSEAAQKVGAKGEAGIDFEAVKLGGEVTGEDEKKSGREVTYEWNIIQGLDAFDLVVK